MDINKSSFLEEWKREMTTMIRLHYGPEQISDRRIEIYLNDQIENNLNDRRVIIVNNYVHRVSRASILELIELIKNNHLICAGGGCLFLPHGQKRNLLIEFILYIMEARSAAKKKRKKFDKGTPEWDEADREQLAFKLIINSLYGCMGYPGFIMFNIFLAESITNQGRHIITSAINAIENFLGNAIKFENPSEVYHVINTIHKEFVNICPEGKFSNQTIEIFANNIDLTLLPEMCTERYLQHCIFVHDDNLKKSLIKIFSNMSTSELLLMYYKNNFMAFSRLDFMKDKLRLLILKQGPLVFCEDSSYGRGDTNEEREMSRKEILPILEDIWDFYKLFVLYDYPIFDRLQKAMYLDKTNSLYTDTDSVFISLDEFVRFIKTEVFSGPEDARMSAEDLNFTAANVTLSIANRMITCAMRTLCKSLQISPEFAKLLNMKNEFFFSRIMFADVKKRYIALSMLQEGQMLYENGEPGKPEIKGFDFKKNGTKPYVRDFYTKLAVEDILKPEVINPSKIFLKFMKFRDHMVEEIKNGNPAFFRQANVKKPEYYKRPFSTQGVCAILLWNALMPTKQLEFPTDINLVPIKDLTWIIPNALKTAQNKPQISGVLIGTGGAHITGAEAVRAIKPPYLANKNIDWFKDLYPEAYELLFNGIYRSTNPLIRHMNLGTIAIPKVMDYELPEYITALIDSESIVNNAMNLGAPLLKSLGIQSFQVSTSLQHMSNLVSL